MGKVKSKIMEQMEQQLTSQPMLSPGSPNMELLWNELLAVAGDIQKAKTLSSSPSMTKKATSSAPKKETLILNARQGPSTTTKEKKAKAAQSTGNLLVKNVPIQAYAAQIMLDMEGQVELPGAYMVNPLGKGVW